MKNEFVKGLLIGFILGVIFVGNSNNNLNAYNGSMSTERGAVEWKPLFVKIVR